MDFKQLERVFTRWKPREKGFDADAYLRLYPDVAAAGVDPYVHWITYGRPEGRLPRMPEVEVSGEFRHKKSRTILIVSHEGSRTGAPMVVYNLVDALSHNYNVVVLFILAGGPITEACVRLGAVAIGPISVPSPQVVSETITQLIATYKFEFAIVNSIESRLALEALARNFVPSVLLAHEFAAYTRPKDAFLEAALWAGATVFSSELTLKNAIDTIASLETANLHIIPQGRCTVPKTDVEEDLEDRILRALRPEGFPKDGLIVLGAGYVQFRKGVDLFIQVASRVRTLAPDLSMRFVWIGNGYNPAEDQSYSGFLADQMHRSNVSEYIEFVGELANVAPAYLNSDVFLLSSRLDPLPNVAIDALSYGLPLLCFDRTTGMAELLSRSGLKDDCVAEYLDIDDMARKLIHLAQSESHRRSVGQRSADIALKDFEMVDYVKNILQLIEGIATRVEQERMDCEWIASVRGLDMDFYKPRRTPNEDESALVREYVRSWASGTLRRKPVVGFHPHIYAEIHGLEHPRSDPYADFLRHGEPPGPWLLPTISATGQTFASLPKGLRVGLHIHVYYPELFLDMLQRLEKNTVRPDLLISVSSEEARAQVLSRLAYYPGRVDARIVPNRGRDIGPFLTEFREDITSNYDIIGHIHTKRSASVSDPAMGRTWHTFLMENLLGGLETMADTIMAAMVKDPKIGIIFPDDPYVVDWGKNLEIARKIGERLSVQQITSIFPVGNMFWARVPSLLPLFDLQLGWTDYPREPLSYDGTELHALERLVSSVVENTGHKIVLTHVEGVNR